MFHVLFCCLLVPLCVAVELYMLPFQTTVERIKPRGFRISVEGDFATNKIVFHVNINKTIVVPEPGDFTALITETTNGRWAYDNINTSLEPNASISSWLDIHFHYAKPIQTEATSIVPTESIEILEFCPTSNVRSTKNNKKSPICEPSPTTVGNKPVCKGKLIFHDDFRILNMTKWKKEVYMPYDEMSAPFVSFQNLWENCYVSEDSLYITPTLQSEVPGFDELQIRSGSMQLENCTGAKDKPWECSRQAKYSQILPPIVSAKIQTKDSFSFRYGRVEVGASLPKGDWLFPMILLEPLENFYGEKNYVSGQIRIAYGGILISDSPALRKITLKAPHYSNSNYHIYKVHWTEDHISLWKDDYEYAYIQGGLAHIYPNLENAKEWIKGNHMAPFDREFYLSLAVLAGGHSEFSDDIQGKPWKNGDPKAMLDFWKDRGNWEKTWKFRSAQLKIYFIKIYAL